jgi:hypothetical protein
VKEAADLLCVLTMFSIRAAFYKKAVLYAHCGYLLFPEDTRLIELYAYALVQSEDYETAEDILSRSTATSANLEYLRSRVSIMLALPSPNQTERIRKFLGYWKTAL